MDVAFLSLS